VTAKHKVWKYFIRRYSSTVEAKGDTEQELLSLTAKVPFDDRYNQSARIDDLSKPLMQAFFAGGGQHAGRGRARAFRRALARQMNVAQVAPPNRRGRRTWVCCFSMKHRSGSSRLCSQPPLPQPAHW
jgi:hypothetical protein